MNKILNGPVIKNQSEDFERIIVFLHGYGANGNDLISIGNAWQKVIPKTIFLSPNAPFDCPLEMIHISGLSLLQFLQKALVLA